MEYVARGVTASTLVNADETLITPRHNNQYRPLRLTLSSRKAHVKQTKRLKTLGSITPFVAADGTCLFIACVIKGAENSEVPVMVPTPNTPNTVFFLFIEYSRLFLIL